MRAWAIVCCGIAAAVPLGGQAPPAPLATLAPAGCQACAPARGARAAVLVAVDAGGRFRCYRLVPGAGFTACRDDVVADGAHCLWTLADVDNDGRDELVVADPSGIQAHRLDGGEPLPLAPRARMVLRTGRPVSTPFLRDLNADGLADATLPGESAVEVWLRQDGGGAARLLRGARVEVPVELRLVQREGRLSSRLESSLVVPQLDVEDLNGDGRLDLTQRLGQRFGFRLQQADGSFGDLREFDLELIRDTTPRSELELGQTAVASQRTAMHRRDLDEDGIPDVVVTHGRKVWVFLAGPAGPQFERAADIKAVAEDITAAVVWHLDGDARPDLLLVRVRIPTAAAMVLGMVKQTDVEVRLTGYRNAPDGRRLFANLPAWRKDLVLRLPPLLSLIDREDEFLGRLRDIGSRVQHRVRGNFDGRGEDQAVLVDPTGNELQWFGDRGGAANAGDPGDVERWLARTVLDSADPVFDLDRLFIVLGAVVDRQRDVLAGTGPPRRTAPLRAAEAYSVSALHAADFDGDGRDELVVVYDRIGAVGQQVIDVLSGSW